MSLRRKTPLRRSAALKADPQKVAAWKRRTARPLPRIGKKGKAWNEARAQAKTVFKARAIVTCEAGLGGCWRNNGLGFAHLKKRRNLKDGDLQMIVLLCNPCHDKFEILPEAEMGQRLQAIIDARPDGAGFGNQTFKAL